MSAQQFQCLVWQQKYWKLYNSCVTILKQDAFLQVTEAEVVANGLRYFDQKNAYFVYVAGELLSPICGCAGEMRGFVERPRIFLAFKYSHTACADAAFAPARDGLTRDNTIRECVAIDYANRIAYYSDRYIDNAVVDSARNRECTRSSPASFAIPDLTYGDILSQMLATATVFDDITVILRFVLDRKTNEYCALMRRWHRLARNPNFEAMLKSKVDTFCFQVEPATHEPSSCFPIPPLFTFLYAFPNLRRLELSRDSRGVVSSRFANLQDDIPRQTLSQLEELDLTNCSEVICIEWLRHATRLRWLNISGLVTLRSIAPLTALPSMQYLCLNRCDALRASDFCYFNPPRLTSLSIMNCAGLRADCATSDSVHASALFDALRRSPSLHTLIASESLPPTVAIVRACAVGIARRVDLGSSMADTDCARWRSEPILAPASSTVCDDENTEAVMTVLRLSRINFEDARTAITLPEIRTLPYLRELQLLHCDGVTFENLTSMCEKCDPPQRLRKLLLHDVRPLTLGDAFCLPFHITVSPSTTETARRYANECYGDSTERGEKLRSALMSDHARWYEIPMAIAGSRRDDPISLEL
eukprot:gene474-857_t